MNPELKKQIKHELTCARHDTTDCPDANKEEPMTEFEHVDFHIDNALSLLERA